jgi:hypothetical protein
MLWQWMIRLAFRTVEFCDACPVETTSCSYNHECSWAQCVDNDVGCFEDDHCRNDNDPCQECNCETAQCQPIQGKSLEKVCKAK